LTFSPRRIAVTRPVFERLMSAMRFRQFLSTEPLARVVPPLKVLSSERRISLTDVSVPSRMPRKRYPCPSRTLILFRNNRSYFSRCPLIGDFFGVACLFFKGLPADPFSALFSSDGLLWTSLALTPPPPPPPQNQQFLLLRFTSLCFRTPPSCRFWRPLNRPGTSPKFLIHFARSVCYHTLSPPPAFLGPHNARELSPPFQRRL